MGQNIIIYIDGFNFYYGLKTNGWRNFLWLNIPSLFKLFLSDNQNLVLVKYFTARPLDPEKRAKQKKLFDVNLDIGSFEPIYGKYIKKKTTCHTCKRNLVCQGCGETFKNWEEKRTDVNIAVHLIGDIIEQKCDHSIIVSADSDLIPPIDYITKQFPNHKLSVFFPPNRHSNDIAGIVKNTLSLVKYRSRFEKSILPNTFKLSSGIEIIKPDGW